MDLHFGPENNLEQLIRRHVFVICPNNSGSSFLHNALAASNHVWSLAREGQHTFGFAGPSARKLGRRVWASKQEWIDIFSDPQNYDWDKSKKAWYFQAFSTNKNAPIFVEKSPAFLLAVRELAENFRDPSFLFMVRNPYATVEGIRRKSPVAWRKSISDSEVLKAASAHVINCLKHQRENILEWSERSIFFSYEQMCEDPEGVEELIYNLVPEIDDLVLQKKRRVKEYDEELRNMNADQIERLSDEDIKTINTIFCQYSDIMSFFRYSFIGARVSNS